MNPFFPACTLVMTADFDVQPTLPGIPEALPRDEAGTGLPLRRWLLEGLRAGVFLKPRVAGRTPTPLQILLLTVLVLALELALSRLEVPGPAHLDLQAWLSGWWTAGVFLGFAWWALPVPETTGRTARPRTKPRRAPDGRRRLFCAVAALVPSGHGGVPGGDRRPGPGLGRGPVFSSPWLYWGFYALFIAWGVGTAVVLVWRFAGRSWRTAVFALVCWPPPA
jgi:hypothetical protein